MLPVIAARRGLEQCICNVKCIDQYNHGRKLATARVQSTHFGAEHLFFSAISVGRLHKSQHGRRLVFRLQ